MPADTDGGLPPVRRFVTGHDASGRAVVTMDSAAPNRAVRPHGTVSTLIWGTDQTPAEICSDEDFGARDNVVQPPRQGSWFRTVDFPPGSPGRMHRTDTVDYVVCLTGRINMEMDDGLTLQMTAGDVMVQQGTNHSWINRGDQTCRIAFALIDALEPPGGERRGPGACKPVAPWPLDDAVDARFPPIRRIVTAHDMAGRAVVMLYGPAPRREPRARGNVSTLVWGTDKSPADIWRPEDIGLRDNDIAPPPLGSWFRVIDYPPGMTGRMHRTDTVDYVICMAGEIDMELDDGAMVHVTAGDVMIQQGTNHSWINKSTEPCRIAFVLLDAKQVG
jgi:quercetin dioxygenase-like cupin family protein